MSENNRNRRSFSAKGYYIALILCAAAIGITGYLYQRNTQSEEAVLQESPEETLFVGNVTTGEDVPALATEKPRESTQPSEPAATAPQSSGSLKTASPVSGEEIYSYSMEALSYNQTTRDWRVHNGVDIAAEEGTPVKAAADGTVTAAYQDDTMGYTVIIRHAGGYTSSYSCMTEDLAVKDGDSVSLGQTIGYVGSSALVETTLGSHVHFAVSHQEKPMDPAEFMALGQ